MTADELRKKYKKIRDEIPAEDRKQYSQDIVDILLDNWDMIESTDDHVLMYYPKGSEPDLLTLAAWVLDEGHELYFPVTEGNDIVFYRVDDLEHGFKKGTFGVMEPIDRTHPYKGEDRSVSFTPGLVFESNRTDRLGYGKGYYDRFLKKYENEVFRIGICFTACVVPKVPTHDGDVHMDYACTEKGFII